MHLHQCVPCHSVNLAELLETWRHSIINRENTAVDDVQKMLFLLTIGRGVVQGFVLASTTLILRERDCLAYTI